MPPFEIVRPMSLAEATALLHATGNDGAVLAGGTNLIPLLQDRIVTPGLVVSLSLVPGLDRIERDENGAIAIGARVSPARVLADENIRRLHPGITQALASLAGRTRAHDGTVGGDLCRRPACWYFRHGDGLLALRGERSLVDDGDNRRHAILGHDGPARFVNPSRLAPVLMALGAEINVTGRDGTRRLPVGDLYRTPRREGESELTLAPGEILTTVHVPPRPGEAPPAVARRGGTGNDDGPAASFSATYEVRHPGEDEPLVAVAAVLDLDGDVIREARIVLGQVAPVPWPAPAEATTFLHGKPPVARTAEVAGERALQGAQGLSGNDHKIRLARVAVQRAVLRAAGEPLP